MSENPYTPDTISTKQSAPGIIVATGVCNCATFFICFYASGISSAFPQESLINYSINVHAFKCRWNLGSHIMAFKLLHPSAFQPQSLARLEEKLISHCSFACQTHYKVIFKTQAQMASCMSLDRCTLKKLAMQSTQKIWPVSSTFIIACHVRQLFRNHFPMLRVYKYGIWKNMFFCHCRQLYQTFSIRCHDDCGFWGHSNPSDINPSRQRLPGIHRGNHIKYVFTTVVHWQNETTQLG